MHVHDLDLSLDAFEGPFDLLLTLLLREELGLDEVQVADVVVAFCGRLAEEGRLDLDACGEFLVLVSSLLELKARDLFPDQEVDLEDLDPAEAAEELARRLEEYRRIREAAVWLRERLAAESDRYYRVGPAPVAPRAERKLAPQDPQLLAGAMRVLATPPPEVSLAHMALRFPPVTQFVDRFRAVLRRRTAFMFDRELDGLSRVEQAVAFLALLELRRFGEVALDQAAPFAPIRVSRSEAEKESRMEHRSLRLITTDAAPLDALVRTLEALLVVASQPLAVAELAEAAREPADRIEAALEALGARYAEGRSGIVLEQVAGGWAFPRGALEAEACARLFDRPVERGLSQAALETLAVIAYLGPCSRPEVARIRGVAVDGVVAGLLERGLIAESGREPGAGGAIRYRTTPLFERVFGLESLAALPRLDDLGEDADTIRERLEAVAARRPA